MGALNRPAVKAIDYVDIGPSPRLKRPDLLFAVLKAAFLVGRQPGAERSNHRSSLSPSAKSFYEGHGAQDSSEVLAAFHILKLLHSAIGL